MALYTDEQVVEWLQKLRGLAGSGADMATAALEMLDDRPGDEELVLIDLMERGVVPARYETMKELGEDLTMALDQLERIQKLVDAQTFGPFVGEMLADKIETGLAGMEAQIDKYGEVRLLCMDAGLIRPGDGETDPLPLLRMFLPVDE